MQVTQQKRMQMLKDTGIGLQMAQLGMAASAAVISDSIVISTH
jgi:hypothetical protein